MAYLHMSVLKTPSEAVALEGKEKEEKLKKLQGKTYFAKETG